MSGQFTFSFAGDDIEEDGPTNMTTNRITAAPPVPPSSAFPVAGKPLLPAIRHDLKEMLSQLPSKIAFSNLDVDLDGNGTIQLPRRELWDVRIQLMAEEENDVELEPGLGSHDVKTGVYEGGFKSWESSVDLVKVLAQSKEFLTSQDRVPCIIELGCGTALPSLALFYWTMTSNASAEFRPITFVLADYNPTVLQLVTLPNFILLWAIHQAPYTPALEDALSPDGELELTENVMRAFQEYLDSRRVNLLFFSGGWSPEFVDLVRIAQESTGHVKRSTTILGSETIYSPFALQSFIETIFSLAKQRKAQDEPCEVFVAAKKLYFGVGGSLDDFVTKAGDLGAVVDVLREETEGVRRGVVRCLPYP